MSNKQNTNNMNTNSKSMFFAGINPYLDDNIVTAEEKEIKGQEWVQFGTKNIYPNYIFDLYSEVPTLATIINSVVDYACGDNVVTHSLLFRNNNEAYNFANKVFLDLAIYNGCYLNILRNKLGGIAQIDVLDYRNVRSDKKNKMFFYSEDFSTKSFGRCKGVWYPSFDKDAKTVPSSIYYIKSDTHSTYTKPCWASASIACEIEKSINQFSLNEINNGLLSNVIISFLNGNPTDEVKQEIEDEFNEKYTGQQNAGRCILNFAPDKDHAVQIDKLQSDDFADRYSNLQERARQEILTSWRCNGNLVGIPTAQGFNSEEYKSSYQLFYKTVIKPLQRQFLNALEDILGTDKTLEIIPFTLDFK